MLNIWRRCIEKCTTRMMNDGAMHYPMHCDCEAGAVHWIMHCVVVNHECGAFFNTSCAKYSALTLLYKDRNEQTHVQKAET